LWPYDRSRDVVGCNIFGIWDVVPALLNGVPAVMLEDATLRDPFALAAAIVRYGITRLMITPTLLDACLACSDAVAALRRLRLVVLCGEAVTAPLMQRVSDRLPGVNVANLYSLAECHDVAAGVMTPDRPAGSCRVADFADVHVVVPEQRDTLLPAGRQGRILVGGRGLARGYLDQRVTAGKFFETTFGGILTPRRVYDTGDLGRLDLDGTLEVVGRIDTEVKIRGAWADPNAVAALLLQHPGVIRAATVIRADSRGHARLHAFVVPSRDASSDLGAMLHADLRTRLPPQSVPARIELLNELPLLPSGKIDTARLASTGAGLASGPAIRPRPARSLGDTVLTTFREVLEQPAVKATDRFDALGGDSLAAIVLCGHIRERTGKPLRLQELYQHPTAAALADFLERHPPTASPNPPFLPFDPLPPAAPPRAERARGGPFRNVLVTGATGTLGATLLPLLIERTDVHVTALVRAIDDTHARARLASALPDQMPLTRVTAVAGDLAQPRLGLAPDRYSQLAGDVDAVLHLGARLDMFAAYDTLAAVNVDGTRAALELALVSGAVFHHLSSSSVLPLDSEERWDETHYGRALLESLAARLVASDGYSQTKLAAETLVWQAAERGLEVIVTRVPHLVGRHHRSRLTDTLEALLELGILPEGGWHWQLAPVDAVCDHLIRHVQMDQSPLYQRHCPLEHVVAPPLTDSDLEAALAAQGRRPRRLTLPALANVIAAAARQRTGGTHDHLSRNLAALDQLAREYGVRAALCLSEPLLESRQPVSVDPARLLVDWLPD
jgi:thioester reductase-like protein